MQEDAAPLGGHAACPGARWEAARGEFRPRGTIGDASDGVFAALAGTDADGFLEIVDEDLAVADAARLAGLLDGFDHLRDHAVGDDHFHFDLRDEVHDVSGAAIDFLLAASTAETLDL